MRVDECRSYLVQCKCKNSVRHHLCAVLCVSHSFMLWKSVINLILQKINNFHHPRHFSF